MKSLDFGMFLALFAFDRLNDKNENSCCLSNGYYDNLLLFY